MSSRWYPLFNRGNPQLRIFLPDFWIKLVRPEYKQSPNIVQFITSLQMTNHDIKNYLEKIYKIPVAHVRSDIVEGELKKVPRKDYVIKDDDYRRAFVTLSDNETFEYPDLLSKKEKKEESDLKNMKDENNESHKEFNKRNKTHSGLPGWFNF